MHVEVKFGLSISLFFFFLNCVFLEHARFVILSTQDNGCEVRGVDGPHPFSVRRLHPKYR